jgi:hypothetical protein
MTTLEKAHRNRTTGFRQLLASKPAAQLALLVVSTGRSTGSAIEQFQNLQAELRRSHANNDWHANLATATEQKDLLNGAPDSLVEVARAQLHVGDHDRAFDALEQVAEMGQSVDLIAIPRDFSALVNQPHWTKLQNAFAENLSPPALTTTAFPLSDSALLAEDVHARLACQVNCDPQSAAPQAGSAGHRAQQRGDDEPTYRD